MIGWFQGGRFCYLLVFQAFVIIFINDRLGFNVILFDTFMDCIDLSIPRNFIEIINNFQTLALELNFCGFSFLRWFLVGSILTASGRISDGEGFETGVLWLVLATFNWTTAVFKMTCHLILLSPCHWLHYRRAIADIIIQPSTISASWVDAKRPPSDDAPIIITSPSFMVVHSLKLEFISRFQTNPGKSPSWLARPLV